MQVDEKSSLRAGSSTGIIVVRDDVMIVPSILPTARDDGVVAGTLVAHQERNERGVVLGDGVWLGTVVVRMTGLPEATTLPHGP